MGAKHILRLILCSMLLVAITYMPAKAAAYKYVPLKENQSSIENIKAKEAAGFKRYNAVVTMDKLKIRKKPSNTSVYLGVYRLGNIVEIIGKSGSFLKTGRGYVSAASLKKVDGMYVKTNKALRILNSSSLKQDSRTIQSGKVYRVITAKSGYLKIKYGRMYGYIPFSAIYSMNDADNTKITIGWESLSRKSSNSVYLNDTKSYVNAKSKTIGLDIISPTWFDITGNATNKASIDILDIADKQYVDRAHNNGYEIWVRFCEMDKKRAAVIFKDATVRARIIDKLLKLAVKYDIDGINVDFEALGIDNRDGFTAFMKELYPKLKKLNMNVSVDITRIDSGSTLYSMCYDRPALAKYSDYLMLMAYDEAYSSSTKAGSVGSYNWVEQSIKDIISQGVPAKKLILGAPFYLRDFSVVPYDFVMTTVKTKIYASAAQTGASKLGTIKKDERYKWIGSYKDWYIIDYNGIRGYISKSTSTLTKGSLTTPGAIETTTEGAVITTPTGSAVEVATQEDIVTITSDTIVYSGVVEGSMVVLGETGAKDYFKCLGKEQDYNIVDYNGLKGYIMASQSKFYKADTTAIGSFALSMQTALDRVKQYAGTISYDNAAKQYVGIYMKDGLKHYVWLETKESMKWRMQFVNKYKLSGAAFWSLYWKTTDGIWDTIKKQLKK